MTEEFCRCEEIYKYTKIINDVFCKIKTFIEGYHRPYINTIVELETDIAKYFQTHTSEALEDLYPELNTSLIAINRDYFIVDFERTGTNLKIYIYSKPNDYNNLKIVVHSEVYLPIVEGITAKIINYTAYCKIHKKNVLSKAKELMKEGLPVLAVNAFERTASPLTQFIAGRYNIPEFHARGILDFLSTQEFIKKYTVDYLISNNIKRIMVSDVFRNAEAITEKGEFPVLKDLVKELSEKSGVKIESK